MTKLQNLYISLQSTETMIIAIIQAILTVTRVLTATVH